MNEYSNHKQVNWQDGMKIDKNHFLDSDQFHIEQGNVTRNIFLNENTFGLLPSHDKTKPANEIKFILEGNNIRITSYKVAVLMFNGMIINADSEELTSKNIDIDSIQTKFKIDEFTEKEFFLIIKANSFENIGYGNYNSEDLPLRRLFLLPYFEFSLVPDKKIKDSYFGNDFLILSKIAINNNAVMVSPDFIPPVTSILSSELLLDYQKFVYNTLILIEACLVEIAKKYGNMNPDSFRDTLLLLSNNLLNALSRIKFEVKHKLLFEPPVELIIRIKELANILNHTLLMRTSIGKDKFLSEVNSILGASKHQFEEMIKQVINLEYRHYNIKDSVFETRNFLDQISKIFKSLSEYEKSKRSIDLLIKRES